MLFKYVDVENVWIFQQLFVFSLSTVGCNIAEMFRALFELLNVAKCNSSAEIVFAQSEMLSKSLYTLESSQFESRNFPAEIPNENNNIKQH